VNDFVEKCLSLVLSFCRQHLGQQAFESKILEIKAASKTGETTGNGVMWIKLRAHNDFYSQVKELQIRGLPFLSSSLEALPAFLACPRDETSGKVLVAKTGMGSSAALTTSLVGVLLVWFGVVSLPSSPSSTEIGDTQQISSTGDAHKKIVHNLAQLAHAIAQGKIGSGFDVSAAVYGTQLYRRFLASGFSKCMEPNPTSETVYEAVINDTLWGQTITPLSLPPHFDIVMGDVCGGSSSTSMAREVLKWKTENPDAASMWKSLGDTNLQIHDSLDVLNSLASRDPLSYNRALKELAEKRSNDWICNGTTSTTGIEMDVILQALLTLKANFKKARTLLKAMGDSAGVGIEPDNQTALADATENIAGVLCAGVPGAGGNDAVFAIIISSEARHRVEVMWSAWKGTHSSSSVVCPLMLRAESGHRSEVHMQGAAIETRGISGVRIESNILWD